MSLQTIASSTSQNVLSLDRVPPERLHDTARITCIQVQGGQAAGIFAIRDIMLNAMLPLLNPRDICALRLCSRGLRSMYLLYPWIHSLRSQEEHRLQRSRQASGLTWRDLQRYVEIFQNHSPRLTVMNANDLLLLTRFPQRLNLRGSQITDDQIMRLSAIEAFESLDLSGCTRITNSALYGLAARCQRLQRLSLRDCDSITPEGIIAVRDRCLRLEVIELPRQLDQLANAQFANASSRERNGRGQVIGHIHSLVRRQS